MMLVIRDARTAQMRGNCSKFAHVVDVADQVRRSRRNEKMRTNYDDPVFSEKLCNSIQSHCSRARARITNQPTAPYEKTLHW